MAGQVPMRPRAGIDNTGGAEAEGRADLLEPPPAALPQAIHQHVAQGRPYLP